MIKRRRKANRAGQLPLAALGMLAMRSCFGITYIAAPSRLPAKAGFAPAELTPSARFFAAVFAAREFLMVAMVLRAAGLDRAALRDALIAGAVIDAFDAAAGTVLALSGTRSRRGAVSSAVTAVIQASLGRSAARQV